MHGESLGTRLSDQDNILYGYMYIIYCTFSYYKCLDERLKWWFLAVLCAIAVIAALTVPVLLVVGSVLSTQNG